MSLRNTPPVSQRLAEIAQEVGAMMGPISPGRPAYYALSHAVAALGSARAEVRAYERDTAGLVRIGQWNEGDAAQAVFMEPRRPAGDHT